MTESAIPFTLITGTTATIISRITLWTKMSIKVTIYITSIFPIYIHQNGINVRMLLARLFCCLNDVKFSIIFLCVDGGGGYYYPVCDIEICKRSCVQHLGYYVENGATCLDGECYCKQPTFETPKDQNEGTTETNKGQNEDTTHANKGEFNWDYSNQDGLFDVPFHLICNLIL